MSETLKRASEIGTQRPGFDYSLLPLGEGLGKRGVGGAARYQALSPTLSQKERGVRTNDQSMRG
jgi:hypothetical protein